MNKLINPTAIVRSVDEAYEDVYKWHEQAVRANKDRNLNNLRHAESLFHIKKDDNFKILGYESIHDYVYKEFNRSRSWTDKLILIHERFVLQLGIDSKTLEDVTFGKLSKLVAHVNEENVLEVLHEAKNMTQADIDKKYGGLTSDNQEVKKDIKLTFSGPEDMMEVVTTGLDIAAEEICNIPNSSYQRAADVPPLLKLEYVMSSFMSSSSLAGDPRVTLDRLIKRIEHVYNINITWEVKNG